MSYHMTPSLSHAAGGKKSIHPIDLLCKLFFLSLILFRGNGSPVLFEHPLISMMRSFESSKFGNYSIFLKNVYLVLLRSYGNRFFSQL